MAKAVNDHLVRVATRLLNKMQLECGVAAAQAVRGPLMLNIVFFVLARAHLAESLKATPQANAGLSRRSLAASIQEPPETVRRHVRRLIEAGLAFDVEGKVQTSQEALQQEAFQTWRATIIDAFIDLLVALKTSGWTFPKRSTQREIETRRIQLAAFDCWFLAIDFTKPLFGSLERLCLFGAVLCAGTQALTEDADRGRQYATVEHIPPRELRPAVSLSKVARLLNTPYASLWRCSRELIDIGLLTASADGLAVSHDWLANPATGRGLLFILSRFEDILLRLAREGFDFDHPEQYYVSVHDRRWSILDRGWAFSAETKLLTL